MRFPWLLCATAGLMMLGVSAFAADTDINYDTTSFGQNLHVTYQTKANTSQTDYAFVGSLSAQVVDTSNHNIGSAFTVYCVDLENWSTNPTHAVVNPVGLAGLTGPYDSMIPGTYEELAKAAWLIDNTVVTNATQGAALQLAIWDVIDGQFIMSSSYGTATGQRSLGDNTQLFFTSDAAANPQILSQAHTYLNLLQAANPQSGVGTLYQVDRLRMGITGQDMLEGGSGVGTHGFPGTPEGASLLMFLPGLIPVAVGLRRRRNKAVGK